MFNLIKKWLSWQGFLALLAGMLLPLAFAPISIFPCAFLSFILLIVCWQNATPQQAFWRGWLYGIGFLAVGISWVFISVHRFGNTSAFLASIITGILIVGLGLYPALQGYVLNRFWPVENNKKWLLAFPATWALSEWLRSWLLTGFPWLLVGHSQMHSWLRGFAPLVGDYGLAFIVTWISASLFLLIRLGIKTSFKGTKQYLLLLSFGFPWLIGYFLVPIQWTQTYGKLLQVSLVQGNIPQEMKWNPDHLMPTLNTYLTLTKPHWNSQIIVWPEAAIPLPLQSAEKFIADLSKQAKEQHVTLLTGIPTFTDNNQFQFYNAFIAIGMNSGAYYKRHLVPFGEYVPLAKLLRGLIGFFDIPMSDFVAGPKQQIPMMLGNMRIVPFVCYEIAYTDLLLLSMPEPSVLVTVSNDAWFGDSLAPAQHLEIGQFRALQAGRYLLFNGNDGITAIVAPTGKVQARIPQFQLGVLTGKVQAMKGTTPWGYIGDGPIVILLMGLLAISFWVRRSFAGEKNINGADKA